MSFWTTLAQLRTILATETDYDSPNSEELMEQIRENIEAIIMAAFDTGVTGAADSDPPDDATGVLTDAAPGFVADEHNGRTLLITSGLAIGNLYTIDDTTATTIVCTGDNLYEDGVREADTYKVLYDLKVNLDGHDHDGVNSKMISASIDQAALKSTTGTVSTQSEADVLLTLPGGQYGFYPQLKSDNASGIARWGDQAAQVTGTTYATIISLSVNNAAYTAYALQRYIQSSGEVYWVFILRDKITKAVRAMWQCPDHPCFGNGNKPKLTPHPFPDYDSKTEEIVVINPSKTEIEAMQKATINPADDLPDRDLLEVIAKDYEIDEVSTPDWPTKLVTVGLPPDWDKAWIQQKRVTPIKKIIPQPEGVLVRSLKKKVGKS